MSDPAVQTTPELVGDFRSGHVLILTCPQCGTSIPLAAEKLKELCRDYVRVTAFAANHICGTCHSRGADYKIEQEKDDERP